jgi:hypothetical protein
MPKKNPNSITNAPSVVKAIEEEKERRQGLRVDEARRILNELESEYEHAKEVFFKVNGAKRILKNHG